MPILLCQWSSLFRQKNLTKRRLWKSIWYAHNGAKTFLKSPKILNVMPIDIIKTFFSFEATLFIGPTLKLALPIKVCCKSVQLVRGSSFWNDLLQNPYFNSMSKKYKDDTYLLNLLTKNQFLKTLAPLCCDVCTFSLRVLTCNFVCKKITLSK